MLATQALDTAQLLLDADKSAYLLGISRTELYREQARGNIVGLKIGRLRRWSRSELERYAAWRQAEAEAKAAQK